MESIDGGAIERALSEARDVIRRQAAEIERLRREVAANSAATELREALALGSALGTLAVPLDHAHLLEMIVRTAVHVISASAGSLLLIDTETQELIFEAVYGGKSTELKKMRMPLGHGVVGLVAATGQALAVSDARHDPRVARDIQERVGYFPDSLLCVPLLYEDQVVGVFELVDKQGQSFFDTNDMEVLGHFADQAAVAIEQSLAHEGLTAIITGVLESISSYRGNDQPAVKQRIRTAVAKLQDEDQSYVSAHELAVLVKDIARNGEAERRACQQILQIVANLMRETRPEPYSFGLLL